MPATLRLTLTLALAAVRAINGSVGAVKRLQHCTGTANWADPCRYAGRTRSWPNWENQVASLGTQPAVNTSMSPAVVST